MKRKQTLLLLFLSLCLWLSTPQIHAQAAPANGQFNGLTLDVARRYYQVDTIKQFITTVSENHGQFVQLHLSDKQSFAIENDTAGQTLANATEVDGVWRNNTTHQPFYSKAQIADLLAYAKQQHITLIPEVDTPAHIDGLAATMKASGQQALVKKLITKQTDYGPEFKLNKASIAFISQLDTEVAQSFTGQENARFHLGGDEFTDQTTANKPYVRYLNALAANIKQAGFIPEAWNDGFLTTSLKSFDPAIQVTYWNWTADEKGSAGKARKKSWATMPALIHHGFKVLNYNDYYLYVNLTSSDLKPKNIRYMSSDMRQNWDPTIWDNDAESSLNTLHGIVGSSASIWADKGLKVSDQTIYTRTKPFVKNFLTLARQPI
ncbi:family 20 glycosylhydrolase [Furfurilactobacillus siliginis]|uniref:Glycoside hydrolase family 20 catalytic domain-containing protein n=1 Tax=Furfurilactobacillus siliginis TaxID=348151 RepID=A0A0R2LDQ4_9LACO|nr:family 20 glycosylhydrolase [Furfurilactobacillus siliginis]KRN97178.1 hypothetical protein IV55_GL000099 [Furfurilactobacillus siliginis]GEK28639.1 hypothetical protein LSI01_09500 [Furfurilactobacillus siliginis]